MYSICIFQIFIKHPLQSIDAHCNATIESFMFNATFINQTGVSVSLRQSRQDSMLLDSEGMTTEYPEELSFDLEDTQEPNTALLSAFLMVGTFAVAYYLRIFRNGKILGRTVSISRFISRISQNTIL